jgi:FixJ family two-component response regulator
VFSVVRSGNGHAPGAAKIYVVGAAAAQKNELSDVASQLNAHVLAVSNFPELGRIVDAENWGCVVTSYGADRENVASQAPAFMKAWPALPVIVWSADLELPRAVEAMKWGAVDALRLPVDNASLPAALQQAMRLGRERHAQWQELRRVVENFAQLSPSEKTVLSLILQGRTNKEVATRLDCSLRTVEARRQRILRVMQTENAIELAAVLARQGMIDEAIAVGNPTSEPRWAMA